MGQLVGGGPAELEQRADVTDADQPIRARPSLPDDFRIADRKGFRIWQGHALTVDGSRRGI
jgi:hypothetical protein